MNKCSIEKAKTRIDRYYTIRSAIPDLFENINPNCETMKLTHELIATVVMPKVTKEMHTVIVTKHLDESRVDQLLPENWLRMSINLQEIRLKENVIFGDVLIFDYKQHSLQYVTKMTPSLVSKILKVYNKTYSVPLKGVYFVNAPLFTTAVVAVLKKLMKPKLFNRVFVCEDTSILAGLPKDCVPKEYGGEAENVKELWEKTIQKFKEYERHFDALDTLRVDETLRSEKLTNNDILGFYGNFKKLAID